MEGVHDDKKPHKHTRAPGFMCSPQSPEVGDLRKEHLVGGLARPMTVKEVSEHVYHAKQPLAVGHGHDYATVPWPAKFNRPAPHQHVMFTRNTGQFRHHLEAAVGALVPSIIFGVVAYLLTFYPHFRFGRLIWLPTILCGLVPVAAVFSMRAKAKRDGVSSPWHRYWIVMFSVSWLVSVVVSEVNFQYFMSPFYELQSMRTYTNINPSEASGMRVMDAASVGFVEGTRVATDMAMSYTAENVYCVAPISTAAGLPSQANKLTSYDFWAVGVNCCKSARTDGFHCGQLDNPRAKMGLRLVDNDQISYFQLAVQQAEAAYNIDARHPVFFYWTEEPDKQLVHFFGQGFKNWVMAGTAHFAISFLGLVMFILIPRDWDEVDIEKGPECQKKAMAEAKHKWYEHNAHRTRIIEAEAQRNGLRRGQHRGHHEDMGHGSQAHQENIAGEY